MKDTAKRFLSNDFFLPFAESRRFIFLYHDISDETEKHFSGEHYSTTVDNFKRQIALLARKFEIIPLDALVTDGNLSRKNHYASIIFDDGFFSVAETAAKILAADRIPFAAFVNKTAMLHDQLWISNIILYKNDKVYLQKLFNRLNDSSVSYEQFAADPIRAVGERVTFDEDFREIYLYPAKEKEKKTYLDTEDVKHLHDEGVLIGSHTTDHYRLNKCTEDELFAQINDNKQFLDELLKTKIEHFAFPFGKKEDYNEQVIEKSFALGQKFVYSTNPTFFKTEEITNTDFLFPRIGLLNNKPEEIMFYINRTFLKKINL